MQNHFLLLPTHIKICSGHVFLFFLLFFFLMFSLFLIVNMIANYVEICNVGNLETDFQRVPHVHFF